MFPVNRFPKTLWFTATLLLCLVCSFEPLAHAEESKVVTGTVLLNQSYSKAGLEYNGAFFEVSGMKGLSNPITCNLYSPNITGSGLKLLGVDANTKKNLKQLNFTLTNALVLNSTIYATNLFPPNSNLSFLYTTADMKGTTTLFNFEQLTPKDGVVVYVVDTTAVWTSGTGGSVLTLVGGGYRIFFENKCGFYLLRTYATGAKNMIAMIGRCANNYCIDMHNGLLAVDYATCKDCTGAFFDGGKGTIANSESGFFRFQNCTHNSPNADQPFFRFNTENGDGFLVFGPKGNIIFSAIRTNGNLFSLDGDHKQAWCRYDSQLVMQHINAKALGIETEFFRRSGPKCEVYLGNITFGGANYLSNIPNAKKEMNYSMILDDFGKVTESRPENGDHYDKTEVGGYSEAYCTRYNYNKNAQPELMPPQNIVDEYEANGIPLDRWYRANCSCAKEKFAPYCTDVYDALLYPQGYTFEKPKCTTNNETCEECQWGNWGVCSKCKPYYEFDDNGNCVPTRCVPDYCALCEENSATKCANCTGNYVLTAEKTCVKPTNSSGDVEAPKGDKGLSTGAIVGIAVGGAAFLLLLLLLILILCCCKNSNEMHVVYQQGYNDDEEEEYADRELRPFNGDNGVFGRVVVVQDYVKPRFFRKDDTNVHGDTTAFSKGSSDGSGSPDSSSVDSDDIDEDDLTSLDSDD